MADQLSRYGRLADLAYEIGMLKHTPRSGFAFLGSGCESVADHSMGAAAIGYLLASLCGADRGRTMALCLFHDLHEAATGDFNYVNHRYDSCDSVRALADACSGTGFEADLLEMFEEFRCAESLEAKLARDADQLDLICALRREEAHGNPSATEWLKTATQRIRTDIGKKFCDALLCCNPDHWWYGTVEQSWWVDRGEKSQT